MYVLFCRCIASEFLRVKIPFMLCYTDLVNLGCIHCLAQTKRVSLLRNHVFYVVLTHDFFCTIGLRSNSLNPSSTPSFHRSQITNFFLWKDKSQISRRRHCHHRHCHGRRGRGKDLPGVGAGARASSPVAVAGDHRCRRRRSPVRKKEGER